jgi:hypothetical protein
MSNPKRSFPKVFRAMKSKGQRASSVIEGITWFSPTFATATANISF